MKICHFDAFSGVAGDMTVGALIDAGADADGVIGALESLATGASYRVERTRRKGISAAKFIVDQGDQTAHRHLRHIFEILDRSTLSAGGKQRAVAVFQKLAEAEANVHGSSIEKVHFHEVGAADSIADIAGACEALELLGIDQVSYSPINTGAGTVKTEHGILPVPAPATARLLEGMPVYARGPQLELTTPTGAAIAAALGSNFGAMPPMRVLASGYGAGDRDFPDHANVLRAILGETVNAPSEAATVTVIEANIDDSTAEILGYAIERIMESGALDASTSPLTMKKGRPGVLLRAITRPEDANTVAELILRETSTLGVRMHSAERRMQSRRIVEVPTARGKVRVKVAGDGSFSPEFEDCRRIAIETGLPLKQIYAEAAREYLKNSE